MKISTKGRYALRLMLDLALASPGEPVPLRDVAQRRFPINTWSRSSPLSPALAWCAASGAPAAAIC